MSLFSRAGATAMKLADIACQWGAGKPDSLFRFWDSLLAWRNSLFESVGNSFPTARSCEENLPIHGSAGPEIEEIPCTFPAYQGIALRDEFYSDPPTANQSAVAEIIARPDSEPAGFGRIRGAWGRSDLGSPPETVPL
jgi:hypothetical protein